MLPQLPSCKIKYEATDEIPNLLDEITPKRGENKCLFDFIHEK